MKQISLLCGFKRLSLFVLMLLSAYIQHASSQTASAAPPALALPQSGAWADYEVDSPKGGSRPRITNLRLAYLGNRDNQHWWQFTARDSAGHSFIVQWLGQNRQPFAPFEREAPVSRYILQAHGRQPLEYRDAATTAALLPEYRFFAQLLPKANPSAQWQDGFFDKGAYLNWPITQTQTGTGATDLAAASPQRIDFQPWLISGTSRAFRDTDGSRLFEDDKPLKKSVKDYTYKNFTRAEIEALTAQGRNYFWAAPEQVEWLLDKPAFFDYRDDYKAVVDVLPFPEALYRPNFSGCVAYLDEPGYLFMRDTTGKLDPIKLPDLVEQFEDEVRAIRAGEHPFPKRAKYGQRYLEQMYRDLGYDLGHFHFTESSIGIYEVSDNHIWYEMEAGCPGAFYENILRLPTFLEQVKAEYGVDYPASDEAMLRFHYAALRGAARNFGGYWGLGIYGEMETKTHHAAFSVAYDMGATRFMFWTGGAGAHVPHTEQLAATKFLQDHARAHPRESWQKQRDAATTCLVLPNGYHLGRYVHRWKALWGQSQLFGLDMKNEHGVTYRAVLTRFMEEAKKLELAKQDFDIAIDTPGFHPRGYRTIIYVNEDATTKVVH